jgi:hypothetical protein
MSALLQELNDSEGDLGGSRTFFTTMMDYLCQRLHVLHSLKLTIPLHIATEELVQLVDFFFHPSRPLPLASFPLRFLLQDVGVNLTTPVSEGYSVS